MIQRVRLDPLYAAPVLTRLPPVPKKRIRKALRTLREDPTGLTTGLKVKRLDREPTVREAYRLRIGEWRLAFVVEGEDLYVLKIFHRDEGYDWLEQGSSD